MPPKAEGYRLIRDTIAALLTTPNTVQTIAGRVGVAVSLAFAYTMTPHEIKKIQIGDVSLQNTALVDKFRMKALLAWLKEKEGEGRSCSAGRQAVNK